VKILHQRETFGNKNDVAAGDGAHAKRSIQRMPRKSVLLFAY
jgi:hypothetical protein